MGDMAGSETADSGANFWCGVLENLNGFCSCIMYQILGALFVLFLPIAVIYFARNDIPARAIKKSKKKKKKSKSKAAAAAAEATKSNNESASTTPSSPALAPSPPSSTATASTDHSDTLKPNKKAKDKRKLAASPQQQPSTVSTPSPKPSNQPNKSAEVDEHMDWTARYSRVMRITREPEEEPLHAVPHEQGWHSVATKKPSASSSSSRMVENEPLTKKQRENQARAAKKREAKAHADALQAERLRRHQQQLEKRRIEEFYSTGAGKHTQWGKKPQRGSSKVPTAKAGLNEHGQLIWD